MPWAGGPVTSITLRKITIFIDGPNFFAGFIDFIKEKDKEKKYNINMSSLEDVLITNTSRRNITFEHIKTYYYDVLGTSDEIKNVKDIDHAFYNKYIKEFKDKLQFHHIKADLKPRENGKEKGVDIGLAIDFLSLAYSNAYDYAVILSGDADYIPAINEVKRYGKIICVASFKSRFNEALRKHIDHIIFLDDYFERFIN